MRDKSEKSEIKFSIIMPTYNRADLLPRAVDSVLNQTYQNFELVIINDGSPDNTEAVIKSFKDKRIVHLKHEKNRGVYAGINTGLSSAKGGFVMLLGDDDELYSDALESAFLKIKEYSSRGVKIFWFDAIDLDTGDCATSRQKEEKNITYKNLLCDDFRIDPVFVADRNLIAQRKIEEKSWKDSGTIWLDLYRENPKYLPLYVPKIICKTRLMQGSHLSHSEASVENIPGVIFAQKTFLDKYTKELINFCPKRRGQRLAVLGFYQILNKEKNEGRENILKSLNINFFPKYYSLFLVSYILSSNQIKYFYVNFLKSKSMIYRSIIFLRKYFVKINV